MTDDRRDVITTTDGRRVQLHPVSQALVQKTSAAVKRALAEQGLPLDPPTYTITTVAGTTETHAHDEQSLSTDEDKAAWAAYQAALARLARETHEWVTKVLLLKGLEAPDPTPEWLAEQEWLGIEVSDDPRERKLEYIQSEILRTPEDIVLATSRIMQLSLTGLPAEDLAAIEATFRSALAGTRADIAATPAG